MNRDSESQFRPQYLISATQGGRCVLHFISNNKLGLPNLHIRIKPTASREWVGSAVCTLIVTRINGLGVANLHAANHSRGMNSKAAGGTYHTKGILHRRV